ncbi:hypothetical protein Y032_0413g992 [Ancylostoma ceylanicum]|uniref:Uncharacterized protein n=1 Tax=Ancylostoma ceylanicum TaxID=53326 RepID=A0A016X1J4_9BILA|nr:hypothetical protein Y032_0413g992 [Ancylostoma ceylanicum]
MKPITLLIRIDFVLDMSSKKLQEIPHYLVPAALEVHLKQLRPDPGSERTDRQAEAAAAQIQVLNELIGRLKQQP